MDLARTIAIFSIVFCHCTEFSYSLSQEAWFQSSEASRYIRTIFFTFGRLGVPIFLMLSGYLLLQRHKIEDFKDYETFIIKKWFPLVLCSQCWIFIYYLFNLSNGIEIWNFKNLVSQLLFFSLPKVIHWWYIPMIVGLYLFVPVLKILKQTLGDKFLALWFLISFITVIIFPILKLHTRIDFSYLGDCYVFCLIFGYVVLLVAENQKKSVLDNILFNTRLGSLIHYYGNYSQRLNKLLDARYTILIITLFLLFTFFSLTVFVQVEAYNHGKGFNVWYNNPLLLLAASSLFVFINILRLNSWNRYLKISITSISSCSFGIYLTHVIFLVIYKSILVKLKLTNSLLCMLLFVCVIVSSYIFVFLTSKTSLRKLYLIK